MPTTIIIDNKSKLSQQNMLETNKKRLIQYTIGINKIVELNRTNCFDIYIADNGENFESKIKIPESVIIIKNNPNIYGKINKGAGIHEIWNNNIEIISKYNYIIHFEPRQELIDNSFINNFIQNPRTLFTYGQNNNHFNTGLFAIKTNELISYLKYNHSNDIVQNCLSLEYILFNYYINNNITYDVIDKMNLKWHDAYTQKTYIM
tara:strand:+ start:135 stop:749 length:615 start_codon:yes stop_codon:yes gene_type:complete